MRTGNSVVVAGSRPSTRPTCSSSSSNILMPRRLGYRRADPPQHERAVSLKVPQAPLERGDGDKVLGGARVPERLGRKARQVGRGEGGQLHRPGQRQGGAPPPPGGA